MIAFAIGILSSVLLMQDAHSPTYWYPNSGQRRAESRYRVIKVVSTTQHFACNTPSRMDSDISGQF
jgi:hypothetical protein